MKAPRLPIAIQQAVMRRLRENLAQANLKLDRHYPEPKLVYTQRGTSAGTAWLESYEIRLNPVLLLETSTPLLQRSCRMNWRICWCGSTSDARLRMARNGSG